MDNLENLYKKSFEDFERKPKADFWDRLAPIIPPKPPKDKDRLIFLLFFCAGLLSMLLIILGYQSFNSNQSNNSITALPIPLESKAKELTEIQVENRAIIDTIKGATFPKFSRQKVSLKNSDKEKVSIFTQETEWITTNSTDKIAGVNFGDKPTETKKIPTIILDKEPAEKKEVPFLSKQYYPVIQRDRVIFPKRKKRKKRKQIKDGVEYAFIGLQYTPVVLGFIKIADQSNNTTFAQNASINQTEGYDISMGIQLKNNWLFQTGFNHHAYTLQQTHRQDITTNQTNAIALEDGFIQAYTFEKQPIIEPIQGRIEVWSRPSDYPEGTTFGVQSTIQQQLKFSSIYSQIGYRYRLSPRWQIVPKLGVAVAWAEKGQVQLTAIDLLDTRQNLLAASIGNTNTTRANFIEGSVSTAFIYRYSKRISFTGTPLFRFGFQPFFTNFQRSTKHRFGQLQLGIRIHF